MNWLLELAIVSGPRISIVTISHKKDGENNRSIFSGQVQAPSAVHQTQFDTCHRRNSPGMTVEFLWQMVVQSVFLQMSV